jgi:hypothetical protein
MILDAHGNQMAREECLILTDIFALEGSRSMDRHTAMCKSMRVAGEENCRMMNKSTN